VIIVVSSIIIINNINSEPGPEVNLEEAWENALRTLDAKEESAWQKAMDENSISAFESYLQNFPDGKHEREAQANIKQLKESVTLNNQEEDVIWNNANRTNTINSLLGYLNKYPSGRYCEQAKNKILYLEEQQETEVWNSAINSNTKESYGDYLYRYPNGKYFSQAQEKISALETKRIVDWQKSRNILGELIKSKYPNPQVTISIQKKEGNRTWYNFQLLIGPHIPVSFSLKKLSKMADKYQEHMLGYTMRKIIHISMVSY